MRTDWRQVDDAEIEALRPLTLRGGDLSDNGIAVLVASHDALLRLVFEAFRRGLRAAQRRYDVDDDERLMADIAADADANATAAVAWANANLVPLLPRRETN